MNETPLETHTRDGIRLTFQEAGNGDPTLVFVHGWAGNHRHFDHALRHFAAGQRVLAPDLRGFGNSERARTGYEVESLADELAWLCAQRGIRDALLVGHSLGGAIALATAARNPELALGLLLFEPAIFFPVAALERIDALIDDLATPACHAAACAYVGRFNFLSGDDPGVRESVLGEIRKCAPQVLYASFAGMRAFDAESSASALEIPVEMVDGARPFVERDRFLRCCPQLRISTMTGVGHYAHLLDPEASTTRIAKFLARLAKKRGGTPRQ